MATPVDKIVDFSVDCRFIVPMQEQDDTATTKLRFLERQTIGVKASRIVAIEPTPSFYNSYESLKRIDLSKGNFVIIPGLINCHTHSPLSLLRGYADDLPLKAWLEDYLWPTEEKFVNNEFVTLGCELSVYEMLKSGTTMFNDMYFLPENVIEVCKRANIRVITGMPCISIGQNDADAKHQVSKSIEFAKKLQHSSHPLVRGAFNPHSFYTLSPEHHERLIEAAKELGLIYHTHVNETQNESQNYESKSGRSILKELLHRGGLNSHAVLAHCVWLTDEEKELLARHKVSVCHCPKSNMKLGSGQCHVKSLHDMHVNVCLGTDSACSNNSLDMLQEAQAASLQAKALCLDASVLDDYTALKMATLCGAKALNREEDLGSLEVGKLCDMVCVDLNAPENFPIYDPLSALLYSGQRKIKYVWIGGKLVVDDGTVLNLQLNFDKMERFVETLKEYKSQIEKKNTMVQASQEL